MIFVELFVALQSSGTVSTWYAFWYVLDAFFTVQRPIPNFEEHLLRSAVASEPSVGGVLVVVIAEVVLWYDIYSKGKQNENQARSKQNAYPTVYILRVCLRQALESHNNPCDVFTPRVLAE